MGLQQWLEAGHMSISSHAILYVMLGAITEPVEQYYLQFSPPHDGSDFMRCYRLLNHCPEWRVRLPEVGRLLPRWQSYVAAWAELESLYEDSNLAGLWERLAQLGRDEAGNG